MVVRELGFAAQIAVGDLNRDGHLDLVLSVYKSTNLPTPLCTVAKYGSCFFVSDHDIVVLLGSGNASPTSETNGLFREVSRYHRARESLPSFFSAPISISDLNGDGNLDVVTDGDILLGAGDGHFRRVASYVPLALTVSDVDGDGKVDLVSTLLTDLVVLPGNGDGTFQGPVGLPSDFANPTFGGYIAASMGDFNGDGTLDLAMYALQAETGTPTELLVYLNPGDGIFGDPTVSLAGAQVPNPLYEPASDLVTGDFNGDGNLDLVAVGGASNLVSIYLGNGDGTFKPGAPTQIGQLLGSATVNDFNHDGNLDIATIENAAGSLYVLFGNGDGTFNSSSPVSIGSSLETIESGSFLHIGDDDRHTVGNDIAVISCAQPLAGNPSCPSDSSVNIISSLATPTPSVSGVISSQQATTLATGDFNHDGFDDFVVGNFGLNPTLTVYLGDGQGNFTISQVLTVQAEQVVVADFNGDGNLDLLTDGYVLFLGKGDGTFIQSQTLNVFPRLDTGFSRNLHVADLNGDGAPDVISTDGFVVYNTGGTFVTTNQRNPSEFGQSVTVTTTVKAGLRGTAQPTGEVVFYDDSALPSTKIGTAILEDGQAVIESGAQCGHSLDSCRILSGGGNFNPHDGKATAVTVKGIATNQSGGESGGGNGNGHNNCMVPDTHRTLQTLRSIDLSRNGTVGFSNAPRDLAEVGERGDQELAKPRIVASPVAPEGELFSPSRQQGLPISAPSTKFFGFNGLTDLDSLSAGNSNAAHRQRSVEPPDQALAVNSTQIIEIVNSAVAIYTKSGTLLSGPTPVNAAFGLAPVMDPETKSFGPFVTDPRALWDPDTDRWFITALEVDTNPTNGDFLNHSRVLLAVSQTSDATAAFYQYSIDITDHTFSELFLSR